ncbi:MAG TPA: discoidin domain-containing protein [Verrucomicrobiae bacterium]|nr:discoidin domain-containing protein [Verrucomicrobiae bacterium]
MMIKHAEEFTGNVTQVSKPAVSPISKSAGREIFSRAKKTEAPQVWKPAIRQTWKSALRFGKSTLVAFTVFLLVLCCAPALAAEHADEFSIAGEWRFRLDRDDAGISEKWFEQSLPQRIQLPGALQSQGFGDPISVTTPWVLSLYDRQWFLRADYQAYTNAGNVKVPFLSQPPRHYLGAAWYQREIEIPNDWENRRLVLFLERPHWESRVWLDDRLIGTNNSLCAPHEFELGVVARASGLFDSNERENQKRTGGTRVPLNISPGKHTLTVRVDNRLILPYRPDAHSVSDSLGAAWNGIVGRMELCSFSPVSIERLRLDPDLTRGGVNVTIFTRNETDKPVPAPLVMLQVVPKNFGGNAFKPLQVSQIVPPGDDSIHLFFPLGDNFERWSEFNPKFYNLRATLGGSGFHSELAETFGMREIRAEGNQILLNGRPIFLRGTHHGGDFPLTGYPATDVDYWRKLIRTCQSYGLNHMRFHSWCPPEAAFQAADELGFYLQPEAGMWNTFNPDSAMEEMLYLETERMIKAYGNHPSFVLFSPSNEPKGHWREVLPKWAAHFRKIDPRRLYTTATGFTDADAPGPMDQVDYTDTSRFGRQRVRGESGWFGRDYSAALENVTVPTVAHEVGQWCAYPDFDVIRKFTGYLQPGNYEIFRDSAAAHGVLDMNKEFARASGKFQLACYKEEIEASLRTPGIAGFQLLDLHDYLGQGTALVGLLDAFWESKGYVTPAEFRNFCNTTVPLARLKQSVFTTAEHLESEIDVAHFAAAAITNATVTWEVQDRDGHAVAQGKLQPMTIPIGRSVLGKISVDLSKLNAPEAYRLKVRIASASSSTGAFENSWNFWLYPERDIQPVPRNILVTHSWKEAESKLATGGKVLFLPRNTDLGWNCPPLDDVPVFWNRLMNPGWGRMLGLWCDTHHPALAEFPTEAHCDWQWTEMLRSVRPINLESFPRELKPVVAAVDDWNRNWKLGAIFECRVGEGRLMVSAFDLLDDPYRHPVARQLLRSLLDYMASPRFEPKTEVAASSFRQVLFNTRIMRQLGATAAGEGNAASAIDGDPNTTWIAGGSGRRASGTRHPHTLTISFPREITMNGIVILPRQNDRDHLGDVRGYSLSISNDGSVWNEVSAGELASTWNPLRIDFAQPVRGKHLRFIAQSGFGDDTSAAIAELAVVDSDTKPAADSAKMEFHRARSSSEDVDEGEDTPIRSTPVIPRNP